MVPILFVPVSYTLLLTMFHFHNINSCLNYFPPDHHLVYIPPSLLSLSLGCYPWFSCFPKSSLLLPTTLYTSSLIFCLQPSLLLRILAFNFSQYWQIYSFILLVNHSFSGFVVKFVLLCTNIVFTHSLSFIAIENKVRKRTKTINVKSLGKPVNW